MLPFVLSHEHAEWSKHANKRRNFFDAVLDLYSALRRRVLTILVTLMTLKNVSTSMTVGPVVIHREPSPSKTCLFARMCQP